MRVRLYGRPSQSGAAVHHLSRAVAGTVLAATCVVRVRHAPVAGTAAMELC